MNLSYLLIIIVSVSFSLSLPLFFSLSSESYYCLIVQDFYWKSLSVDFAIFVCMNAYILASKRARDAKFDFKVSIHHASIKYALNIV